MNVGCRGWSGARGACSRGARARGAELVQGERDRGPVGGEADAEGPEHLPHWVVLDEAHYSLHHEGVAERAFAAEDKGLCLVTYKSSWVRPSVMSAIDVLVFARTTAAHEVAFLRSFLANPAGVGAGAVSALATLPPASSW